MTNEIKENLQFIIKNLQSNNQNWFEKQGITVKRKGDYWVLNYIQHADKNPYNILTRGLVIHKNGYIASCPFFRFFNYGESHAAKIDFQDSEVLEKLDGSLVAVFFPDGDINTPIWHFRNLISSHEKDLEFTIKGFIHEGEHLLLMEVHPYLKEIKFSKDLHNYSVIFEFISHANTVITKYEADQYGLYLIGARHLPTLNEMTETELDLLASHIGVRRPRKWSTKSYEEIIVMMKNFPVDYEGFVVRDRTTGERIKIKSEDYLKRHRLLTKLNYKTLIPLYLDGERDEIEAYMPQVKTIFDKIDQNYQNFVKKTVEVLTYWQDKNVPRKSVALGIINKEPKHVCAIVFKLLETTKNDQETAVKKLIREIQVPSLIEALELKDDVIEEVIEEII